MIKSILKILIQILVVVVCWIAALYLAGKMHNKAADDTIQVGEVYVIDSEDPFRAAVCIYVIEKKDGYAKYVYVDGPNTEVDSSYLEHKIKWSNQLTTLYEIIQK